MARLFSNRSRHFDMGDLPTELLARDAHALEIKAASSKYQYPAGPHSLNEALAVGAETVQSARILAALTTLE